MSATKHPSMMDKRTKEYKDWAAQNEAGEVKVLSQAMEASGPNETSLTTADLGPPQISEASAKRLKAMESPAEEKKAPTRPWEKKNGQRPWRRDYFNLHKGHEGFRPRFVDPAKVEGRVQRGYVVANPEHYGGLVDIDIRESQGMGKYISRHGMILMEIPEEGAKAYEQQQDERIKANYKKMNKEVRDDQDKVVDGITIESAGMQ